MATIQRQDTIALTSTTTNIIAGSKFEFAGMDQILNLGFAAEGTGLLISVALNDQVICEDVWPSIKAANLPPIMPDDYPVTGEGMVHGDRLTIKVQNTTGAAIKLITAVNITPA
jgi:hypothetical protein